MSRSKFIISHCTNHNAVKSIGRCKTCGKPICAQCALMYRGQLYCVTSCLPSELISKHLLKLPSKKFGQILLWTLVTLLFCLIAAASYITRDYYHIKQENFKLRESRAHLVETLRHNNLKAALLASDTSTNSLKITDSGKPVSRPVIRASASSNPGYSATAASAYSFNNSSTDKRLLALTFDGSYESNAANSILDTLRSRNVKVTFFLTGQFLKLYPDLVNIFLAEGHEIGNHTFTHPHLTSYAKDKTQTTLPNITQDLIREELSRNEELFKSITGQLMAPLWRAPYGECNKTICDWAGYEGYTHVGWRQGKGWTQNLDSNDWIPDENTPGFKTPSEVLEKILNIARTDKNALNGGIILMHLGTVRKNPKMQVHLILGTLIDSLSAEGYKFVKISVMARESGFSLASSSSKTHIVGAHDD